MGVFRAAAARTAHSPRSSLLDVECDIPLSLDSLEVAEHADRSTMQRYMHSSPAAPQTRFGCWMGDSSISRSRRPTGIRANPLDSTRVVETFWDTARALATQAVEALFEEPLRVAGSMKHPQHVDVIDSGDVTDPELLKTRNRPQSQARERRIGGRSQTADLRELGHS